MKTLEMKEMEMIEGGGDKGECAAATAYGIASIFVFGASFVPGVGQVIGGAFLLGSIVAGAAGVLPDMKSCDGL